MVIKVFDELIPNGFLVMENCIDKKINFSSCSRFRKIFDNNDYSPFRTSGQDRTDLFKNN